MYWACWEGALLHTALLFSSDQPCPRPEDLLWGLSSALQRCEDGSGLRRPEALPADGLEQAHSGECRLPMSWIALCPALLGDRTRLCPWLCSAYLSHLTGTFFLLVDHTPL